MPNLHPPQSARHPGKPTPLPSLVPFIVVSAVLLLIYVGVLLFPAVKHMIDQQDCIATGRVDCIARSG